MVIVCVVIVKRPLSLFTPLPPVLREVTPSPTFCSTYSSFLFLHNFFPSTFPLSLPSLVRLSLPPLPSSSSSGMVNESRQVLQEPDFAQLLLRDPGAPVVRKSRGTSTQGTSTHASSTHLAMLDEPPSGSPIRASSLRSKTSSFHGSLHRSRDGRWEEGVCVCVGGGRWVGCVGGYLTGGF